MPRPIRPQTERRPGVGLGKHPASAKRVHLKWARAELPEFVKGIREVKPCREIIADILAQAESILGRLPTVAQAR